MALTKIDLKIHYAKYLKQDDNCYFFITYTPGGYDASPHNSLVMNFKKDVSHKNSASWRYRDLAVQDFATMLHEVLRDLECSIIPCATSKPRNSPNFNNRLDATVNKLANMSSNYSACFCLDTIKEHQPSHIGGTRNPQEIISNTKFIYPQTLHQNVVLIDDVFTTGAHFRAYKDIILSHFPSSKVIGIFLAKYDGSSLYGGNSCPF